MKMMENTCSPHAMGSIHYTGPQAVTGKVIVVEIDGACIDMKKLSINFFL
jgi:hypothetical protein